MRENLLACTCAAALVYNIMPIRVDSIHIRCVHVYDLPPPPCDLFCCRLFALALSKRFLFFVRSFAFVLFVWVCVCICVFVYFTNFYFSLLCTYTPIDPYKAKRVSTPKNTFTTRRKEATTTFICDNEECELQLHSNISVHTHAIGYNKCDMLLAALIHLQYGFMDAPKACFVSPGAMVCVCPPPIFLCNNF